jgi:hypothetical protein
MWDPDIAAMNLTDPEKEGLQVYRTVRVRVGKCGTALQLWRAICAFAE